MRTHTLRIAVPVLIVLMLPIAWALTSPVACTNFSATTLKMATRQMVAR